MAENKSQSPLAGGSVPKAIARRTAPAATESPLANARKPTPQPTDGGVMSLPEEEQAAIARRIQEVREQRVLHGDKRGRLEYDSRPGFMRRWVNELHNGRVAEFLRMGWAFVKGPDGKGVERGVGVHAEGGKLPARLMEIPQEIYDEDFNKKQEIQDRRDQAIYYGTHDEQKGDNRYVPRDTPINFRVNTRSPFGK